MDLRLVWRAFGRFSQLSSDDSLLAVVVLAFVLVLVVDLDFALDSIGSSFQTSSPLNKRLIVSIFFFRLDSADPFRYFKLDLTFVRAWSSIVLDAFCRSMRWRL